jgi:hypothetical protein
MKGQKISVFRLTLPVILLLLLSAGIFQLRGGGRSCLLVSCHAQEGTVHYRLPLETGRYFTLAYTHSVSNSEVCGTFGLTEDGRIKPLTTRFLSFGPGLPLTGGSETTVISDGGMTVLHQEEPRDRLRLWVSPLTGETLAMGETTLELAALSPEPMLVEISVEKWPARLFGRK